MTRIFYTVALFASLVLGAGCAMCDSSYDDDYGAYGGICEDAMCGARAGSNIVRSGSRIVMDGAASGTMEAIQSVPPPAESPPEIEAESNGTE